MFSKNLFKTEELSDKKLKKLDIGIFILLCVGVFLIVFYNYRFTVPVNEVCLIKTSSGMVRDVVYKEGVHYKTPFSEKAEMISLKPFRIETTNIVLQSSEKHSVKATTTLIVKIDPDKLVWIYKNYGSVDSLIDVVADPLIRGNVVDLLYHSGYKNDKASLEELRKELLNSIKPKLADYGLIPIQLYFTQYETTTISKKQ